MQALKAVESTMQRLQVEDAVAAGFRRLRPVLPALARFLLVSTFLEDALRLVRHWDGQCMYFERHGFGAWGAAAFVAFNVAAQVVGSVLVMGKLRVGVGVGLLIGDIVIQAVAYNMIASAAFVLRLLSVCGGLLLVLAEAYVTPRGGSRSVFAGLPELDQARYTNYLQLAGRLLLVCLCLSIMVAGGTAALTPMRVVLVAVGTVMSLMVVLGFKAKMTSVVLLVGLSLANIALNAFWQLEATPTTRDVVQYDFFQTLSVLGGFILLALLGPGDLSVDERKKGL